MSLMYDAIQTKKCEQVSLALCIDILNPNSFKKYKLHVGV